LAVDNARVQSLKRPAGVVLIVLGGAVVLGGAGLLLGPGWAVAGVAVGPFVSLAAASVVLVLARPDASELLQAGRHREALPVIAAEMPTLRLLARMWPGQFRDALAHRLMDKSMALLDAHRDGEALVAAEQSITIYRSLAADRPGGLAPELARALNNLSYPLRAAGRRDEAEVAAGEAVRMYRALAAARPRRYGRRLAGSLGTLAEVLVQSGERDRALAATSEAVGVYQDAKMRAGDRASSDAAEVLFLHGQLLCGLARHREAALPLAQAWHLAARRNHQEPGFDKMVLQAAYRADPAGFLDTWRAEIGGPAPGWLTGHDGHSSGAATP
jgi:tetratricopeptide (TPR) repeat protein